LIIQALQIVKKMKAMRENMKILSLIWMNTGMMIVTTTTTLTLTYRRLLRSLLPTQAMMKAVMMMTPTTLTAHARSPIICLLALGLRVSALHQLLPHQLWWTIKNFREEQLHLSQIPREARRFMALVKTIRKTQYLIRLILSRKSPSPKLFLSHVVLENACVKN
jgi:hypothetical protein